MFNASGSSAPLWLGLAVLGSAALLSQRGGFPAGGALTGVLPSILCSTSDAPRTGAVVTTLRSEPIAGMPNKRMTTQLVRFPPGVASPRHAHGGDLTVYVVKGVVRSEHAGLPLAEYRAGDVFHEPYGTVHEYIDNPSATEWAELLAVMVHDEGAPLTTLLE